MQGERGLEAQPSLITAISIPLVSGEAKNGSLVGLWGLCLALS